MATNIIYPIKFSESSDQVSNLQSALLLLMPILGFADYTISASELEEKSAFDGTIEGVKYLRDKFPNEYNQELLVDDLMAGLINGLLGNLYAVNGRLTDIDRLGIAEQTVVIAEYDLDGFTEFDKKTTNADGAFAFSFMFGEAFQKRDGKTSPDLLFRVFMPSGEEFPIASIFNISNESEVEVARLADSTAAPIVLMNVPKEITIRIVPVQKEIRITEFERLVALLFPFMGDKHFADLKEDDKKFQISFLIKESGVSKSKVEALKSAFAEERTTELPAWAFFGLSQLPLIEQQWNDSTFEEFTALLKPLQPQSEDNDLKKLAEKLRSHALNHSQEQEIQQNTEQLLAASGPLLRSVFDGPELMESFLKEYAMNTETLPDFWAKMKADVRFDSKVSEIQLTLQLSQLTLNNSGLVSELKRKGIQETKELIQMEHLEWFEMIKLHPEGIPSHIPINSELNEADQLQERASTYARELETMVEIVFPTESIKTKMGSDGFKQFLDRHPDFDFTKQPVETLLLNATEESWMGIDQRDEVVKELRKTQRLYNLTASVNDTMALANKGFESAFQISKIPLDDFVLSMNFSDKNNAMAIHAKALAIVNAITIVFHQLKDAGNGATPSAIGKVAEYKNVLPNWENLFGQVQTCECEHCRSVYSPAAYFVDLLHILLGQEKGKAREELFRRRPDLKYTKLSCEHTDTLIPYIDLANEILETYVAQQDMGTSEADSHAIFATIDTSTFTEEELSSNPHHPNPMSTQDAENAYLKLSESIYPLNLPFDLNLETVREFLISQGTSRLKLMETFGDSTVEPEILAEGLGLSALEYNILTGIHHAQQLDESIIVEELFGTHINLSQAKTFLEKTGIRYLDLVALVNTVFLNPDGKIGLGLMAPTGLQGTALNNWNIAHNCDLEVAYLIEGPANILVLIEQNAWEQANVTKIGNQNLLKFNRYVRLWKKLGCTIEELDALLMSINGPSTLEFTPQLLNDLSLLWQLANELRIPLTEASLLLGNIPTRNEHSLYAKLFLNKAILQLDTAFELNNQKTELLDTTISIGGHIPALCAALKISEPEIKDILSLLQVDLEVDLLSVSSISSIYRLLTFSKINSLKVHELILLKPLAPTLPVRNMKELLELQEFIEAIQSHDLKPSCIAYLFGNVIADVGTIVPKEEVVKKFQKDLQNGLERIQNSLDLGEKPIDSPFLKTQLGRVLDEPELDKLVSILDGSYLKKDEMENDGQPLEPFSEIEADFILKPGFKEEYKAEFTYNLSEGDVALISAATQPLDRYVAYWSQIRNQLEHLLRSTFVKQHLIAHFQVNADSGAFAFPIIGNVFMKQGGTNPPPIGDAYIWLFKFFWLSKKFSLSSDELNYFQANGVNFGGFDWNDFSQTQIHAWLRVGAYCKLRNGLPKSGTSLIEVFKSFPDQDKIVQAIVTATGFDQGSVAYFVNKRQPIDFIQEKALIFLQNQIRLSQNMGISIEQLEEWSNSPLTYKTSQDIKRSVKAKYSVDGWVELSTQVNNILRNKQRDALVAYLLHSKVIKDLNVSLDPQKQIKSANGLYAYFLIDLEMDAVMKTSRLKQAIASVQLFTQRCIMNLEPSIPPRLIDQKQWSWMKYYRVWEANRKVFLYPENWIEPELRDGKSPFFKELESELLQGEVTPESVEKAIQNYLFKLNDVARLDICGIYEDKEGGELHVFGRTFNNPPIYYYRKLNLFDNVWTAWEKVQLDIQGNDEGANPGVHLIPVVWNRRLYLFWPIFTEKSFRQSEFQKKNNIEPDKYWEIKMAWSQYSQNKWSSKKVSKEAISSIISTVWTDSLNKQSFLFSRIDLHSFKCSINSSNLVVIEVWRDIQSVQVPINNEKELEEIRKQLKGLPVTVIYFDLVTNNDIADFFNAIHNPESLERTTKENQIGNHLFENIGYFQFESDYNKVDVVEQSVTSNEFLNLKNSWIDYQKQRLFSQTKQVSFQNSRDVILKKTSTPDITIIESNAQEKNLMGRFILQDYRRNYYVEPKKDWYVNSIPGIKDKSVVDLPIFYKKPDISKVNFLGSPMNGNVRQMSYPVERIQSQSESHNLSHSRIGSIQALRIEKEQEVKVSKYTTSVAVNIGQNYAQEFAIRKPITKFDFKPFFHPYVDNFLQTLNASGIGDLLDLNNQKLIDGFNYKIPILTNNFDKKYKPNSDLLFQPYPNEDVDFRPTGAYSIYNWELFFHIPILLANRLSHNQKFEDAMRWYHFVFDPTTHDLEPSAIRYWKVIPLRNTRQQTLEALMLQLKTPQGDIKRQELENAIENWRKNPFNPHLIARMRLVAYQKNVLMKYLDNMIAWADNLFRQDTIESINQATQLYIIAAELLGKRPEKIPARGKIAAKNYHELEDEGLNAFSNAQVMMETIVPFFNLQEVQTNGSGSTIVLSTTVAADYFGMPDNPKLLGYWDTVADRLFKIRHSLNIEGVERTLALNEPPIDPAFLVQALAKGMDIESILSDLNAPLPYYRFNYIVQKALEICNELKSLGNSMLSALEKKDNEAFSLMRSQQETSLISLMRSIKELQIKETQRSREGLEKAKEITEHRLNYYKRLFDIGLNDRENEHQILSAVGLSMSNFAQGLEIAASLSSNIPDQYVGGLGGMGGGPIYLKHISGGSKIGGGLSASARAFNSLSSIFTFMGSMAQTNASYGRRSEEWKQQKELAQKELLQIQKQIDGAKLREEIADKDLRAHEQQIENALQVEDYLRNKYTQEELYGWMIGEISTVYFQCYQLVYDLAKKAEKTYRHELGIENSNFVQFGVWDSFRKGLLSGESLYLSLKQMEKAYMDQNRREFELTKHVSLMLLDPLALIKLRSKGTCDFMIPEALYDMDHPGQYFRRIKSVSVSIPCIAGPYTSVNAKLSLMKSRYRYKVNNDSYPEAESKNDSRFKYTLGAIQSIATSHGQNDSGMFELNFRDERYLPFEYAGAISTWRLELPTEVKQFDYNTISDVVIHVKYTARDGGSVLKKEANDELSKQLNKIKQGLEQTGMHIAFNMKHDLQNEWHLLKKTGTSDLLLERSRLPYFALSFNAVIEEVMFLAKLKGNPGAFKLTTQIGDESTQTVLAKMAEVEFYKGINNSIKLNSPFKITVEDAEILEDLVLVVKYKFVDER